MTPAPIIDAPRDGSIFEIVAFGSVAFGLWYLGGWAYMPIGGGMDGVISSISEEAIKAWRPLRRNDELEFS